MSSGTPVSVFISYSREDSSFVDRLEADLQARTFRTWVDRRRLEGGQDWLDKIQDAIEQCDVLLVVLSPSAVASEYVRMEYRHARRKGKLVIPLDYQACKEVPMDLNHIQWVNFLGAYEQGLNDVLISLSNVEVKILAVPNSSSRIVSSTDEETELVAPQPASPQPAPELDDLYRAGVAAKARDDLERAYVLWQQILDREPHFRNDTLIPWCQKLSEELHTARVKRLRERAEQAHIRGEWGQAIGSWEALLGLEPRDGQAMEDLEIAQYNQKFAYLYDSAAQFVAEGDTAAARTQLEMLWYDAPGHGDPLGLAKNVKLPAPLSYSKWKVKSERHRFITAVDSLLGKEPFWLMVYIFCLLTGAGISAGILTQSWRWALGTVVIIALLVYQLGYRKAVTPVAMPINTLISGIATFGITFFLSSIGSQLRTTPIERELIVWLPFETLCAIGLSIQAIIPNFRSKWKAIKNFPETKKLFDELMFLFAWEIAIGGAIATIAIIGAIWTWLWHINFGWDFSLVGIPISILNGIGLTGFLLIGWNTLVNRRNKPV